MPDEPWGYPRSARRRGRWSEGRPTPITLDTVTIAACEIALDEGHTSDDSRTYEMLTRFQHGTPADLAACEFWLTFATRMAEHPALGPARVRDLLRYHERRLAYSGR